MNFTWKQGLGWKTLATVTVVVAVIVVYLPGLHGPFVFDDEIHVLSDPSIRISSLGSQELANIFLNEDGSSAYRPLAKITLAINYYFSQGATGAFGYKLTNLAIHLANTGLVYWFSLLLCGLLASRLKSGDTKLLDWMPILATALWALHPLHLTSVLYVVQRMTSLSAFFVLAGLIVFVHGRQRIREKRDHGYLLMSMGAVGGTALGLACKENAVLLLPLMLVIEFVFFSISPESASDRRKLTLFYGLTVFMPALVLGLWLIAHPDVILDAYRAREFTLIERILTESRVIWFYVGLLFLPDVRRLALYHDDIPISTGLLQPWTTSIAIMSILLVFIAAILARRKYPAFSFAVLWYLVGHSMESGFIGLEIAYEHRNYLPDIGILLAVAYGLFMATQRLQKYIGYALLLAPAITLGFVTNTLANTWASDTSLIESLARYHPNSARGQYMLAELYAERQHDLPHALVHYRRAADLAPNETGYLVKTAITAAKIRLGHNYDGSNTPDRSRDSESIDRRLKGQPLTSSTLYILEQMASCTDQISEFCKLLYPDIKGWYLAAVQNSYISNKNRSNILIYLFNMGTARPDLDLSLQAAKWGMKFEPSNPDYSLMEANVYLLRGNLETAENLLQEMKRKNSTNGLTSETRDNIAFLLREIESRKSRVRTKQK